MGQLGSNAATVIMGITVLLSLLGIYSSPQLIDRCLFRPYWLVRSNQYPTIVTSGLVHADIAHLIFNMVTFWFFAFPLEARIGQTRFVVLYAFGLLLSHSCTYFKQKNNPDYASLGASGAISAVLFAYIVYFPNTTLFILPIPFPIPAAFFAVGYVAYSYWAANQQRGRINHDAHLCGALAGVIFVVMTDPNALQNLARLFS